MLSRLLQLLLRRPERQKRTIAAELPSIPRERVAHLLMAAEGMPQVDWGMAEAWIAQQTGGSDERADELRRAVAAAWLDDLCDALPTDSRRWRTVHVEGLAPNEGSAVPRTIQWAERSIGIIGRAMREIRGDPRHNPIPPIAVVALGTADEYYSFISHFYHEEGEYATSGGVYLGSEPDAFPALAVNGQFTDGLETTIAHELTHHALKPDRDQRAISAGLPLWAEEGLTQMMEEHVTRISQFVFGHEMLQRHRALWSGIGFDGFAEGATFHSPVGEAQELSYNLAEALTRSLLSLRKRDFFAFARACRNEGVSPEEAAIEHLGGAVQELAEATVFGRVQS